MEKAKGMISHDAVSDVDKVEDGTLCEGQKVLGSLGLENGDSGRAVWQG